MRQTVDSGNLGKAGEVQRRGGSWEPIGTATVPVEALLAGSLR
jgi:hypothetical protein